jgi:hypothetical protein
MRIATPVSGSGSMREVLAQLRVGQEQQTQKPNPTALDTAVEVECEGMVSCTPPAPKQT